MSQGLPRGTGTRPSRPNAPAAAWIACVLVVYTLYTVVPLAFFNDGDRRIAGMPSLLFWFTLLPWFVPGVMLALYLLDARMMRRIAEDIDE